jgi:hypothetical protein
MLYLCIKIFTNYTKVEPLLSELRLTKTRFNRNAFFYTRDDVEESEESSATDVLLIKRLRDIAAKKHREKKLQTKISDFFRRSL